MKNHKYSQIFTVRSIAWWMLAASFPALHYGSLKAPLWWAHLYVNLILLTNSQTTYFCRQTFNTTVEDRKTNKNDSSDIKIEIQVSHQTKQNDSRQKRISYAYMKLTQKPKLKIKYEYLETSPLSFQ